MKLAAAALAAVILALPAGAGLTLRVVPARTIVDANRDNRLEYGQKEGFAIRTDLAPQDFTSGPKVPLVQFAQMTDTQLVDEESPARVEFIDRLAGPFIAAYRTQEGLLPFVLNEEVRAVRAQRPELVMVTGDNADNAQLNETRWFIDILDGGVVDPNSGVRGSCRTKRGSVYNGVRGGGRYYNPNGGTDGAGYSPSQRLNRRRAARSAATRDYPGLFDQMNRPFRAIGLGSIPWYTVVGNHDALIQGNIPGSSFFSQTAMGCVKVTDLSRRAWNLIRPLAAGGVTDAEGDQIVPIVYGDVLATLSNPDKAPGLSKRVARDPRRRLLFRKQDLVQEHFRTRGAPTGHGYGLAPVPGGTHYSFSPKPRVRFVALDSVADSGPEGNLDEAQFQWVHTELLAAEARRELVILFAHHSLPSMSQSASNVHYGLGGSCPSTLPGTPTAADESLVCLLTRHPSVVAFVAGHSHRNRITPFHRPGRGGFWEIVTSSHTDWPQQSRIIDLIDNGDTLSLQTFVINHAAPPRPPAVRRSSGRLLTAPEVTRLASIARELAFNNPQAENGEDGFRDRRGTPEDRHAVLYVPEPY